MQVQKLLNVSNYTVAKLIFMLSTAVMIVPSILYASTGQYILLLLMIISFLRVWPMCKLAIKHEESLLKGGAAPNFRTPLPGTPEFDAVFYRTTLGPMFCFLGVMLVIMWILRFGFNIGGPNIALLNSLSPEEFAATIASNRMWSSYFFYLQLLTVGLYVLSCTPRTPQKREKKASLPIDAVKVRM